MTASLFWTRPAGISSAHDDEAVRQALQDPDRPPTPPHVHRFRDLRIEHEPGMPVRWMPLASGLKKRSKLSTNPSLTVNTTTRQHTSVS